MAGSARNLGTCPCSPSFEAFWERLLTSKVFGWQCGPLLWFRRCRGWILRHHPESTMKQTWINYIQHVPIFISHIVTILVYVHTHIYLFWCVCPPSNGNHQIFVVGDPHCTFPTPLRDTTHLWTIGGCTGCGCFHAGGRSCFWVLAQGLLMPEDLKHMLYDCHVSNIANSSGIFSVDELWRSIGIIQLVISSDLRYNQFVGSNHCGGWNDDCYILFCNCQLVYPWSSQPLRTRSVSQGNQRKGLFWEAVRAMAHSFCPEFQGLYMFIIFRMLYKTHKYMVRIYNIYIYIFARTRIDVYTQCHSDPMV